MGCIIGTYIDNKENIASIGIGAMIIFIAMVFVAGIAASVLVQTSTQLEMQALETGYDTVEEVSSGIRVDGIEGYNISGSITKMAVEISARAGSPDIDIGQAVLEISDSSTKHIVRYGNTLTSIDSLSGDLFDGASWPTSDSEFYVVVFQDADDSCSQDNPVINFGDHVVVAVNTTAVFTTGISPSTDVFGLVVPEIGAAGIIGFKSPSSFADTVMELQ